MAKAPTRTPTDGPYPRLKGSRRRRGPKGGPYTYVYVGYLMTADEASCVTWHAEALAGESATRMAHRLRFHLECADTILLLKNHPDIKGAKIGARGLARTQVLSAAAWICALAKKEPAHAALKELAGTLQWIKGPAYSDYCDVKPSKAGCRALEKLEVDPWGDCPPVVRDHVKTKPGRKPKVKRVPRKRPRERVHGKPGDREVPVPPAVPDPKPVPKPEPAPKLPAVAKGKFPTPDEFFGPVCRLEDVVPPRDACALLEQYPGQGEPDKFSAPSPKKLRLEATSDELRKFFHEPPGKLQPYMPGPEAIRAAAWAINSGWPIILQGPPGTGKTELAKRLAAFTNLNANDPNEFIRLQCFPGMTSADAIFEWNHTARLTDIQMLSGLFQKLPDAKSLQEYYQAVRERVRQLGYIDVKPILRALLIPHRTLLLIDELDKADREFDTSLLEFLDAFSVTIPEIGTIYQPGSGGAEGSKKPTRKTIKNRPIVIVTSNDERPLQDALMRRALNIITKYPTVEAEAAIGRQAAQVMAGKDVGKKNALFIARHFAALRAQRKIQRKPATSEIIGLCVAIIEAGEHTGDRLTWQKLVEFRAFFVKGIPDNTEYAKLLANDATRTALFPSE